MFIVHTLVQWLTAVPRALLTLVAWLPRLVILGVIVVIGYTCVTGDLPSVPSWSCGPSYEDRTPEAQQERWPELRKRLIFDEQGNIIGVTRKE